MTMKKSTIIIPISIFLLFVAFLLALTLGAEKIPLAAFFGGASKFQKIIIWNLRLPRALLVLLTGILLGGSGAVFQMFFRNPLAEPGIMGISAGATLGAVVASVGMGGVLDGVVGGGAAAVGGASTASASVATATATMATATSAGGAAANVGAVGMAATSFATATTKLFTIISPINLFAFLGALGAGALVTFLAFSRVGKSSSVMLLLCGTALGTLYSSISSMILLTTNKEFHSIYTWILGSFNGRSWKELIFILIPSAISIIIMFAIRQPLDLLGGGEKSAASLGVEVDRLRILVLISGALAVSAAVCAGGTISFVGLIAPHLVRKLSSPKSRTLVPLSMIFGAILMLLADTLARILVAPAELPAGIITSILGVPFFLSLCLKRE